MERESEIVAQAGRPGAVTIATNMAGRGTDIILGGNSDYMARLKLRETLKYKLVRPEDPNLKTFSKVSNHPVGFDQSLSSSSSTKSQKISFILVSLVKKLMIF